MSAGGWLVETVADAPMRPRAWFADLADAQCWAEEHLGWGAVITAAPSVRDVEAALVAQRKELEEQHERRERELRDELDDAQGDRDEARWEADDLEDKLEALRAKLHAAGVAVPAEGL